MISALKLRAKHCKIFIWPDPRRSNRPTTHWATIVAGQNPAIVWCQTIVGRQARKQEKFLEESNVSAFSINNNIKTLIEGIMFICWWFIIINHFSTQTPKCWPSFFEPHPRLADNLTAKGLHYTEFSRQRVSTNCQVYRTFNEVLG